MFGAFAFGHPYFGQATRDGIVPPTFVAIPDITVVVRAYASRVIVPSITRTVIVPSYESEVIVQ